MLEEANLLSAMTALYVDHTYREAEHFLIILAMLEKGIYNGLCEHEFGAIENCDSMLMDDTVPSGGEYFAEWNEERDKVEASSPEGTNEVAQEYQDSLLEGEVAMQGTIS